MIAVSLTRGFESVIDDEDIEIANRHRWQVKIGRRTNYAICVRRRRTGVEHVSLHRLILGARPGQIVDHRDGNGLNNTRANLRLCTTRDNAENRSAYVAQKRARGGFLGIYRQGGLWVAAINAGLVQANGERKKISLKCYATPEEAARVYDSAAAHYFGEFAARNFPDETPIPFDLASLKGTSTVDKGAIFAENMRRSSLKGEAHPRARLTENDVREIRASSEPAKVLAARFDTGRGNINLIRRCVIWKNVQPLPVQK